MAKGRPPPFVSRGKAGKGKPPPFAKKGPPAAAPVEPDADDMPAFKKGGRKR